MEIWNQEHTKRDNICYIMFLREALSEKLIKTFWLNLDSKKEVVNPKGWNELHCFHFMAEEKLLAVQGSNINRKINDC